MNFHIFCCFIVVAFHVVTIIIIVIFLPNNTYIEHQNRDHQWALSHLDIVCHLIFRLVYSNEGSINWHFVVSFSMPNDLTHWVSLSPSSPLLYHLFIYIYRYMLQHHCCLIIMIFIWSILTSFERSMSTLSSLACLLRSTVDPLFALGYCSGIFHVIWTTHANPFLTLICINIFYLSC